MPRPYMAEIPPAPQYNPLRDAVARTTDKQLAAVLQRVASMPPSTGVIANPVRHHCVIHCGNQAIDLNIRSFAFRGCLLEEDIVTGAADAVRTIFVGLFGRFPGRHELKTFSRFLSGTFADAIERVLPDLAAFMKRFPAASADVSMQYMSAMRKASGVAQEVRSRPPAELLRDLMAVHLENVVAGACSSYMRAMLVRRPKITAGLLLRETKRFIGSVKPPDPFGIVFCLLLRRRLTTTEADILHTLGTIQIHHGSAGSNMVARYLASLHTRSISDIFTASQMALDCARHFGAISDMTDFIAQLENKSQASQDRIIHQRAVAGNLPAFGHPEIAAAGRSNQIELDPRPAIYLSPLFRAIDSGQLEIPVERLKRILIAARMYELAFVEGIEKPGHQSRLRIAPNTDFGAWIVQESLGVAPLDRTLLSYVFRGFGWMMDVREQLQQPIIRPVIPPDPQIIPNDAANAVIPEIIVAVHDRLRAGHAFTAR
jgi:citrate synthase